MEKQKREDKKWRRSDREKARGEQMQVREKGRKIAKHDVFPMVCGAGGSKSRLAKAAEG